MRRRQRSLSSPFASWREIDLRQPLTDHPLNTGRRVWWLVLPPWRGSSLFRDLCKRVDGTLTNMDPATDWVGAQGRPGGWGALDLAAGAEKVEAQASGLPGAPSDPFTIAYWHRTRAYVSLSADFGFGPQLPVGTGHINRYSIQFNNNYYFYRGTGDWDTLIPYYVDSLWHHVLWAYDGSSNFRLFVDGILRASRSGDMAFETAGNYVTLGSRHSGGASSPNTQYDDCTIYGRSLSDAEARSLFDQSRHGYPDLLRRHRPVVYSVPSVVTGTNAPRAMTSYRRRRV